MGKRIENGAYYSPEYRAYMSMMVRCYSPKCEQYKNYGARGIVVCESWKNNPSKFLLDMGPRPDLFTLERIDNDKGYSADNCRWASKQDQARNRRTSIWITLNGKRELLIDAVARFGKPYRQSVWRYHKGWSAERIVGLEGKRRPA